MKVFFDANVIIAAIRNPAGTPRLLLEALSNNHWLYSSDYVWREVTRNLVVKSPKICHNLSQVRPKFKIVTTPNLHNDPLPVHPKDLPVYRAAQFADCDFLTTGNLKDFKDVTPWRLHHKIKVLSPRQLWDFLYTHQHEREP